MRPPRTTSACRVCEFLVDGVALGAGRSDGPYARSWDSTTVADGAHTLTSVARMRRTTSARHRWSCWCRTAGRQHAPHYLEFDGVDDYVSVADAPALSFGDRRGGPAADDRDVAAARRDGQASADRQMGRSRRTRNIGSADRGWHDAASTCGIRARAHGDGVHEPACRRLVGAWHHLAVTYDGRGGATAADGITIYIDGVRGAALPHPTIPRMWRWNLAAPVEIGAGGPFWNQYDGGLDEIRCGVSRARQARFRRRCRLN